MCECMCECDLIQYVCLCIQNEIKPWDYLWITELEQTLGDELMFFWLHYPAFLRVMDQKINFWYGKLSHTQLLLLGW